MKILHVGPVKHTHSATGLNQSIPALATAQANIGLEVGLLPSLPAEPGVKMMELPGVKLLTGPHKRQFDPWHTSKDWITHIQSEFGTPDLVNFHSTYIPFQTALARRCRQFGWPYIVTPRGGMTYLAQNIKGIKKRIANFLFFRCYVKHAAAIHALNTGEAKQIQAQFKVKRAITVPNGVPEELFELPEELSPIDLGDFGDRYDLMLGFVGRIDVYIKGLDFLLKALSRVKLPTAPSACKLLIVGPFFSSRDKKYVLSTITRLRLQDTVKLVGPKYGQEKLRHFLACNVCVQTSRSEGMPMAVIEAMALGRPCLVTTGTNMADVVRQGGGWVCQDNPKSIAEAIKSIYEKRDFLEALGQQSRKLVQSRFTWRRVSQRLSEEYAKIIEQDKSQGCT